MAPPEQVLHLYRRLLRATTYVPDSFARAYVHQFLVSRFKANCTLDNLKKPNAKALATNRLKKARHWVKILESATRGSIEDLQKVLIQAHGRQGARKRILIRQLLQPEESRLPKDDTALEDLMRRPVAGSKLKIERGTKIHTLAKSQMEHHPVLHIKAKLRHLEPKIPAENIWARPTPRGLAESLRRKWWAESIDKLLPPVPQSEWQRLRDLATGAEPLEKVPPRRARGTLSAVYQEAESLINGEQLLNALRSPARPSLVGLSQLEFDPSKGLVLSKPTEPEPRVPANHARSMRRMYSDISIITPLIIQDEVTKNWVTQWGGQKSKALNGHVSKPMHRDLELFEGIGSNEVSAQSLPIRNKREKQNRNYDTL